MHTEAATSCKRRYSLHDATQDGTVGIAKYNEGGPFINHKIL
jgi:hypothetical protein